jgi:hypothetical protein
MLQKRFAWEASKSGQPMPDADGILHTDDEQENDDDENGFGRNNSNHRQDGNHSSSDSESDAAAPAREPDSDSADERHRPLAAAAKASMASGTSRLTRRPIISDDEDERMAEWDFEVSGSAKAATVAGEESPAKRVQPITRREAKLDALLQGFDDNNQDDDDNFLPGEKV